MSGKATVKVDFEEMSVAEQIRAGLESAISHARGKDLTLRTTLVPAAAPELGAKRVAALRSRLKMSQGVFAAYLNVSVKTVQSWEQGTRSPKAGEARLLQIVEAIPARARKLIEVGLRDK